MAENDKPIEGEETPEEKGQEAHSGLERGTYEIIRNRLSKGAHDLRERLGKLNEARKEVFGSIETKLLATERIATENKCIPRDMTPIGNQFLFAYNVQMGLRTQTRIEDIFSVYEFRNNTFHPKNLDLINDGQFQRDFTELFKYYKNTVFAKFSLIGPHLFMVFRIGKEVQDIKTFKWLVEGDTLKYLNSRSDHEYHFPPQHEFKWKRTHRDMHSQGLHPHVNIANRVFVETVGGDLTIKIENNTASGKGIYAEPVENPDQTLDDAEYFYAIVGNLVLLKIRPYQEERFRYFIYCEKTRSVARLDSIEKSCVLLPDDHGVIFSNGYFLQTGEYKVFDNGLTEMVFSRRIQASNGEDYLFVFYNRLSGHYALLPYNLIEQRVGTPIIANGYALFTRGELVYFRDQNEPQRNHALQIWQTPFVGDDHTASTQPDSFIYKLGNKEVVRGMAECHELINLTAKDDTYTNLFFDMEKKASNILDAYHWLDAEETFHLREVILRIQEAAKAAINEFEKVTNVRQATASQFNKVATETHEICNSIYSRRFEVIEDFVRSLVDLRSVRGEIISLRDLRYVELDQVEALEKEVEENTARLAHNCVLFLLKPESLKPYEKKVEEQNANINTRKTVAKAKKLAEEVGTTANELEMLIEIVSNLKIDDATQRTTIIDSISAIFSRLNQTRAALKNHIRSLARTEGVAEFNSQMKLLNQSVANYIDVSDTPEKCEDFLTRLMVQIEELEGKFAEFDEFVLQFTEKREEVYNAFETRKLQLVEARNRRATILMNAANRILKGIKARVEQFASVNEINGYFASDLMIEKIREIATNLGEIDDSVKVDDIQSRLKTIREDAVRQLKDRQDLYEDGDNIIRLGKHRFSVNNQAFDLTSVLRDGEMHYHLSGTNYFERITDPDLLATREVWDQEIVSETAEVYRSEYLAYLILNSAGQNNMPDIDTLDAMNDKELSTFVQRFMGPRYSEAYIKGVNDQDATRLLRILLRLRKSIGLLRFHPRARALATAFWHQFSDGARKQLITSSLKGFASIRALFPNVGNQETTIGELRELMADYLKAHKTFPVELLDEAAEYLHEELSSGTEGFVISKRVRDLRHAFFAYLDEKFFTQQYKAAIEGVRHNANAEFQLQRNWVYAFLQFRNNATDLLHADPLAALLLADAFDPSCVIEAPLHQDIPNMAGSHTIINNKVYSLNYNAFTEKMNRHFSNTVPLFKAYSETKKRLLEEERTKMRLDEFRPRVLTSFVRNKLIDNVYLPLVGDNLAKQIGSAGEGKRTDLMGMLLIISPPGYGKTTLMEYIANRLGLVFMKINGPALGHRVTSLDPAEAPNAAAREEMQKLNLAFEMGDNVMIYIDDIQHCNPEFLQKFISLCDAQRRIEGVYKGRTRTYDLRGKKVAVVMAGNPYTESGEKFKIPDMLANRADTYNLGEIIGGNNDFFQMSYLENALTSNPVLDKLASRSQKDVYTIIKMAETGSKENTELEGTYSLSEVDEMLEVMRKLIRVRDIVLSVNKEYIRSAGISEEYRIEPAFKLQGSYRNMNRIAEKVVAVMNDEELEMLILDAYRSDAQTLASDAESNILRFKELVDSLSPEEAERLAEIRKTFSRNQRLKGIAQNGATAQILLELSNFSEGLEAIRQTLTDGTKQMSEALYRESHDHNETKDEED